MLVIAYCDVGPGSDWSYFKPKKKGESAGNVVGPGTIAKATARRVRTQRVFLDLREAGEGCSKHRVARLMREHQLIDELDRCGQAGTAASVLVPELGPISRPESSSPI